MFEARLRFTRLHETTRHVARPGVPKYTWYVLGICAKLYQNFLPGRLAQVRHDASILKDGWTSNDRSYKAYEVTGRRNSSHSNSFDTPIFQPRPSGRNFHLGLLDLPLVKTLELSLRKNFQVIVFYRKTHSRRYGGKQDPKDLKSAIPINGTSRKRFATQASSDD